MGARERGFGLGGEGAVRELLERDNQVRVWSSTPPKLSMLNDGRSRWQWMVASLKMQAFVICRWMM